MIYVTAQRVRVPALGFGTFGLAADSTRESVFTALESGYRHIDAAQAYDNEEYVGAALAESKVPRTDLFLTTKLNKATQRYDDVKRSLHESLEKLHTDYVDLFLIHWPSHDVPLEETMRGMNEVRAQGLTRHIGVSNFPKAYVTRARALAESPIFCNQVEYHALLSQDLLLEEARAHDSLLTAHCPLGRGIILEEPVLAEIGKQYAKSAAQVGIRWLLSQPNVATFPPSEKPARIRANFDVFDFALSGADMQRIATLPKDRRVAQPPWAPQWDEPLVRS